MQQLRFGLIGWGYWGPKLARNLESLPQASLEIVADLNPLSLSKVRAERPWIKTTSDVEEIFTSDIDGVVIATPVATHFELARAALGFWSGDDRLDCLSATKVVIKTRKKRLRLSNDGEVETVKTPLYYQIHPKPLRVFAPLAQK